MFSSKKIFSPAFGGKESQNTSTTDFLSVLRRAIDNRPYTCDEPYVPSTQTACVVKCISCKHKFFYPYAKSLRSLYGLPPSADRIFHQHVSLNVFHTNTNFFIHTQNFCVHCTGCRLRQTATKNSCVHCTGDYQSPDGTRDAEAASPTVVIKICATYIYILRPLDCGGRLIIAPARTMNCIHYIRRLPSNTRYGTNHSLRKTVCSCSMPLPPLPFRSLRRRHFAVTHRRRTQGRTSRKPRLLYRPDGSMPSR